MKLVRSYVWKVPLRAPGRHETYSLIVATIVHLIGLFINLLRSIASYILNPCFYYVQALRCSPGLLSYCSVYNRLTGVHISLEQTTKGSDQRNHAEVYILLQMFVSAAHSSHVGSWNPDVRAGPRPQVEGQTLNRRVSSRVPREQRRQQPHRRQPTRSYR